MKKQNETAQLFKEIEMVFRNGEEIKGYVFTLVGVWAASLNYNYYTTEYFPAESCDPIDSDPKIISDKRNAFIEKELEGLGEEVKKVKTTLELYHINTNPRNIRNALETIFNSGEQYLQNLKNWRDNKSHASRNASILRHFESVELEELIYYLGHIYLDLLKLREFLLSKIEKAHKISEVQTNEKRLRITEISKTSFKWTHNLNQDSTAINVLHSELLQNGFINSDLRVFKKAFEGVKITEQVKWTSDPVNLIYFYHLLFENNLIDGKGKKKDWKKLKYCFDYPSINEAQNLSQILNGSQTLHKKVFFENLINSILPE